MQEESIACSPAGKMRLARQPVLHKPGQHIEIHTPTRQASTSTGAVQREGRMQPNGVLSKRRSA